MPNHDNRVKPAGVDYVMNTEHVNSRHRLKGGKDINYEGAAGSLMSITCSPEGYPSAT